MKKLEVHMVLRENNVLGEEVEIRVASTSRKACEWVEKDATKECGQCPNCVGRRDAKSIIKRVRKEKRYLSPPEEHILGLCTYGIQAKVLTPPRTVIKRCRYVNGQN